MEQGYLKIYQNTFNSAMYDSIQLHDSSQKNLAKYVSKSKILEKSNISSHMQTLISMQWRKMAISHG